MQLSSSHKEKKAKEANGGRNAGPGFAPAFAAPPHISGSSLLVILT